MAFPCLDTHQYCVIGTILLEELQKMIKGNRAILGKTLAVNCAFHGLLLQVIIKYWQRVGK